MIYLDNAATTFPKPRSVTEAVLHAMRRLGGNPGRSGHSLSLAAAEAVYACRSALGALLDCPAEGVLFTLNTTYALNEVIKGTVKPGDHILLSDLEHNAVWRPICALHESGVEYSVFHYPVEAEEDAQTILLREIEDKIKPNTRLLVCTAASNVVPIFPPLKAIGGICRKHGIFFAVDGAQAVGHIPISMKDYLIDALCLPSHKGLYGPMGCGVLALAHPEKALGTLIEGGSGVGSLSAFMPVEYPERAEAGTLPLPAIAGLEAGVRFIEQIGFDAIRKNETACSTRATALLSDLPRSRVYIPQNRGALVLFSMENVPSDRIVQALSDAGICARGGFHCAPLAHACLGTPNDGAVRLGFGVFNRPNDLDAVWKVLKHLP